MASSGGSSLAGRPVSTAAPADTNVIKWVAANSDWEPGVGGGGGVASVSGTAGRVTSSGGANPVIDLANSGVTAGFYGFAGTFSALVVDAFGRITAAAAAVDPRVETFASLTLQ